jgi:hypothetical protein
MDAEENIHCFKGIRSPKCATITVGLLELKDTQPKITLFTF